MSNTSGQVYGLTLMVPLKTDDIAGMSPAAHLRTVLGDLNVQDPRLFDQVGHTYFARLMVLDDVPFQGNQAHEEHLKRAYLYLAIDCENLKSEEAYLHQLVKTDSLKSWMRRIFGTHALNCPDPVGKPGEFVKYLRQCQLETTFLYAATDRWTPSEVLSILSAQTGITEFVAAHQVCVRPLFNGTDAERDQGAAVLRASLEPLLDQLLKSISAS